MKVFFWNFDFLMFLLSFCRKETENIVILIVCFSVFIFFDTFVFGFFFYLHVNRFSLLFSPLYGDILIFCFLMHFSVFFQFFQLV